MNNSLTIHGYHWRRIAIAVLLLFSIAVQANAETLLKPYILAATTSGDIASVVSDTKGKLTAAGFEVVGEYSPYPDAAIIAVTNDALKNNAAASDFGAFGAAQRVTVTKVKDQIQVAFTNPVYMANAYRMKSDLSGVADQLKQTLGDQGEYGPDEGLSAEDLRDYQYKWLMPYFYDRLQLATYKSYDAAVENVEKALQSDNKGGVEKVYRIDLPGKQETVIGVHMKGPENVECSGDQYIMSRIDFKDTRSTGHLPYEVVISGNKVYALPAEFRIAISFPDLSMIGSNSFASIMCAPNAIQKALTFGTGGKLEDDF
ncbi:MAG: hypothetical protein PVJ39_03350 [Gammaproteobacteria bacterium]|jgi:hypothetical protein